MGKVKMRYSVYSHQTGYFTKYRTITIPMKIPTDEYGFIQFYTVQEICKQKAKELIECRRN